MKVHEIRSLSERILFHRKQQNLLAAGNPAYIKRMGAAVQTILSQRINYVIRVFSTICHRSKNSINFPSLLDYSVARS